MNTISAKILTIIFIYLLTSNIVTASEKIEIDSTFQITVEFSMGYTSHKDTISDNASRWGITPSMRILWEPNHLLNLGIETALIHISDRNGTIINSEFGNTNFEASLDAIPILLVFNMEVWEIEFNAAMGISYVWSTLDAFDSKIKSHEWDYCMMFSWEYSYQINNKFATGLEFKTYYITKLEKTIGGIMLKLQYNLYEW